MSAVRQKLEPFTFGGGFGTVGKSPSKQIKEIEKTQEALRESIEQAKELAEKAQELLQKHKKTVEDKPD